ncbi:hypothetical protein EDD15DRAFT_2194873 [Pisolithus albus]|nr:hypothetical protein EDD15DRAFT_2194873 [Pisolithus albus]
MWTSLAYGAFPSLLPFFDLYQATPAPLGQTKTLSSNGRPPGNSPHIPSPDFTPDPCCRPHNGPDALEKWVEKKVHCFGKPAHGCQDGHCAAGYVTISPRQLRQYLSQLQAGDDSKG